ncbi:MAG: transglutaminase domain-containing protein [Deltaproteobacteria bacterium]|nr:MAG: transglutaminase domain-containing protein [Deltaproteobacteria bacterium]
MGIYYKGRKIGYVVNSLVLEKDRYRLEERSYLKLKVMGEGRDATTLTNALVESDFSLNSFDFQLKSGVIQLDLQGQVKDKELFLQIDSAGNRSEETILLKEIPRLPLGLDKYLIREGIEIGKKYFIPLFEPTSMSTREMTVEVLGEDEVDLDGKKIWTYKLKETFLELETISWITAEGKIIREESPLGFVSMSEKREDALSKGWEKGEEADIIASTAIRVETLINPKYLKYLKVKLKGISLDSFLLKSPRQKIAGDYLEIRLEDMDSLRSYQLPNRGKELKEFLEPSPLIQSDSKEILLKAKEILKGETDALMVARKLGDWLYKNLGKKPTISIPSALAVLKAEEGDCNEHTALYTALSRAAGIPTKIDVGLVYMDGYFYYHAWPEVYLGQWVAIDPTLGQFPADVTHIKLLEGELEKWIEIMKIIGKVKIEILDYE